MDTITVTTHTCRVCGKASQMEIPAAGLIAWNDGALVQDAFPQMSIDEREMLISGTHPACWDALFGEE